MSERLKPTRDLLFGLLLALFLATPAYTFRGDASANPHAATWWVCPLVLLLPTFVIGILAVLGGVGGSVLLVPTVSGLFPIHLNFVRATGLIVAPSNTLAAGPGLLRANLASLRLVVAVALVVSAGAILGAMIGLTLPTGIVEPSLGLTILAVCVVMLVARRLTLDFHRAGHIEPKCDV